jgi:hypothetical protein
MLAALGEKAAEAVDGSDHVVPLSLFSNQQQLKLRLG